MIKFTSRGDIALVLLWLYLETSVVVNTDNFSEAHVTITSRCLDSFVVVFLHIW